MKRFLIVIAIALVALAGTSIAYAQAEPTFEPDPVPPPVITAPTIAQNPDGTYTATSAPDPNAWNAPDIPVACNWDHPFQCLKDGFAWLALLVLQISLFILAVTGAILDMVLYHFGINMSVWIGKGTGIGDAISLGWTVFRDLGNLALIAGLIWAAISMILNAGGLGLSGGKPGSAITKIIIAAILVNFSYFFAGAVVDASNVLSRLIYEEGIKGVGITLAQGVEGTGNQLAQAGPIVGGAADITGDTLTALTLYPIGDGDLSGQALALIESLKIPGVETAMAGVFLQQTRLLSIIDQQYLAENIKGSGMFFTMVTLAVALFGATVYIFCSIAFMIIARFAIIIVLLVTSPVFVLGFSGLPRLKEWGEQWWKTLVAQSVFLPVFFLLVMTSFNVIGAFWTGSRPFLDSGATAASTIGGIFSGDFTHFAEAIKMLLLFAMAWGMLRLSLYVAKAVATGSAVALPDINKLQEGTAKAGEFVGTHASNLANLPGRLIFKPLTNKIPGAIQDVRSTLNRINPFRNEDDRHHQHIAERQEQYILDTLKTPFDEIDPDKRKTMLDLWKSLSDEQRKRIKKKARTPEQKKGVEEVEVFTNTFAGGAGGGSHPKQKEEKPPTPAPGGQPGPQHAAPATSIFKQAPGAQYAAAATPLRQGGESFETGFKRIDSRLAGMEEHDRQRSWNEMNRELVDEAKEKANAKYIVSHLSRRLGKEMPHEVMAHPNVLAEVNEQHVVDYAARSDVSNEKFGEIITGLQKIGRQSVVDKAMTSPAARRRTWSTPPPPISPPPPPPAGGTTI